jgi:HEAT repeat protein
MLLALTCLVLVGVRAEAQTSTPTPVPVPAAPSAPAPQPIPPVPVGPRAIVLPEPLHVSVPFEWDAHAMEDTHRAIELAHEDLERLRDFHLIDPERLHERLEYAREATELAFTDAQNQMPRTYTATIDLPSHDNRLQTREANLYGSGLQALSRHQYDRAITAFDQVIARKETRTDAALYWKAFAQFKAGRSTESQTTLVTLRRDHPQSRYLAEAKMLEADMQRQTGQPVSAEDQAVNDDIKILAIQSMQRTDPERALPLLEGVLTSANSLEVKKRAIYVLALSEDTRARPILLRYAKGAGSPDLQPDAIRYLASRRDQSTTGADLRDIYESTQDPMLRRVVIDAYRTTGDKTALMAVTVNPANPLPLRQTAVSGLARIAAPQELWALYQKEPDPVLRTQIASVLASMGAMDQVTEIARADKDITVRQRAIRSLGGLRHERAGQVLVELYGSSQDRAVRTSIIQALGNQANAEGLVSIARTETNLDLKKQIVSQLSNMASKSPVAADYLMEMLKR